ncbi:hypothetical protein G6F55_006611 [Rhizopus delemar]|uniref:Uncharacterized protein n=3 Tax=Rhizopus TaxID=4842 RepID=I1C5Y7_RHIO9|nr:hypothetical protein RO3G_08567 [Rhizopus delemar RA 99-880]KAG1148137.1 hypothetical protein G6F36_014853 [Rhizopus arrhizus]KAG1456239.1 hypothetical protein G6F55_006611 [Rhizopus delemar]EIE83867.1 hypothetical protein RO3G_08572 [Rhizopus delemar RA 99-880]KAG1495386.1 hypothetical protein G6F54_007208 [Rhizopus delemar]|eukprot:EIE83862.1 hypothetical protein RO3G_08567 [Rhizopus delemar RA 99-880]
MMACAVVYTIFYRVDYEIGNGPVLIRLALCHFKVDKGCAWACDKEDFLPNLKQEKSATVLTNRLARDAFGSVDVWVPSSIVWAKQKK